MHWFFCIKFKRVEVHILQYAALNITSLSTHTKLLTVYCLHFAKSDIYSEALHLVVSHCTMEVRRLLSRSWSRECDTQAQDVALREVHPMLCGTHCTFTFHTSIHTYTNTSIYNHHHSTLSLFFKQQVKKEMNYDIFYQVAASWYQPDDRNFLAPFSWSS
mmetsp:Transcript_2936/g.4822  ORF Transcript_2936/g.4822 Transcript_2936/m.4822 type:complete len:160 (-) Transcript_2936:483-962(-)